MPTVHIPSLMRDISKGDSKAEVKAKNLRQVIEQLEMKYPGIKERLCDADGRIRPSIGVSIDGVMVRASMITEVGAKSQIHFLPAVSGGQR